MSSLKQHRYSTLEFNTLLQLRAEGLKFDEIATIINSKFNTNRTAHSIECKLSGATKRDTVKKIFKLTEEDKVLVKYIKLYPTNIQYAINLASNELKVDFNRLQNRYYRHLKHHKTILTVGSEIGFSNNVKNNIRDIDGNLPTQDMSDVQWLMKQILSLPEEQRNKIKSLLS